MSTNILQGLCTELNAVSGLNGKVFPLQAQQGTSAPYLVYATKNSERKRNLLQHDGLIDAFIQLAIYHTSFSSLKSLTALVIAEIKTWERTSLGSSGLYVQHCTITDEFENYNDEVQYYEGFIEIEISYIE